MHIDLDPFDLRILDALQTDGRISNAALAERLALSPSACLRRLRALEESGMIRGYSPRLDAEALGYGFEAYVHVNLQLNQKTDPRARFAELVLGWPEIVTAAIVTGETQYLLHVRTRDLKHYSTFVLERLYREAGALEMRSCIVLTRLKEQATIDLAPLRKPPRTRTTQRT
jgi:DNA-binding Lrp family transcriptional regulator